MHYHHTQRGPLGRMLLTMAISFAIAAGLCWHTPPLGPLFLFLAVLLGLLSAMFWNLTVSDGGDALIVRFGPLPLFGTRIDYSTITAVETGRSSFIDGWGIHWIPGRGWTFNLWGWDCVILHQGRTTLRIGTDDPEGLATHIQSRLRP